VTTWLNRDKGLFIARFSDPMTDMFFFSSIEPLPDFKAERLTAKHQGCANDILRPGAGKWD
jgi:hypothetical protein